MREGLRTAVGGELGRRVRGLRSGRFFDRFAGGMGLLGLALMGGNGQAQVNVLTAHNDIARTGQNVKEAVLTPLNVRSTQFGKLFSQSVNGLVFGQPLYVSQPNVTGLVTQNVIYVATTSETQPPLSGYLWETRFMRLASAATALHFTRSKRDVESGNDYFWGEVLLEQHGPVRQPANRGANLIELTADRHWTKEGPSVVPRCRIEFSPLLQPAKVLRGNRD
jgi:hypothetical protein